ncbi:MULTISPECIES: tyrosine-type recombinase/integrase [Glycomyces]|uniref:Integrase n=2 Tax=Glycomyces TaxID=58113 RepID=A0A9X3PNV3_9ACTN|nr:site-specific integrase [Glycomyces lechevalierae]MDA1387108.1 site-specific integrase [Glycomyces lechevalierae]MDR7336756.1 integrase [Glycomyces lechevalierae]
MSIREPPDAPHRPARKGSGSIYWDSRKQCFIGSVSLGTRPDGSRIRPKVRGHTFAEASAKLDKLRRDCDNGIDLSDKYTVAQAAREFLADGTRQLAPSTLAQLRFHAERWIIPGLGHAKLKRLRADDVDVWLNAMAEELSPSSVKRRLSTLRRIIRFAEAHNHVERNVASLIDPPRGKGDGRSSQALTLEQVHALLEASRGRPIGAYIALSAFTGIRTEEARPLEWRHLHLRPVAGQICSCGGVHTESWVPHVEIWHSVRGGGETKTPGSRRTVALPELAVEILTDHQVRQQKWRARHGWKSSGIVYVFGTRCDTVPMAEVVRQQFKDVVADAGIAGSWTPRDLRHTFVSIMSERGASVELIADLVGHKDLATTWTVYRHQLRPVITEGADLMDAALQEQGSSPKGTILASKRGSLFGSPLAGDNRRKPHEA